MRQIHPRPVRLLVAALVASMLVPQAARAQSEEEVARAAAEAQRAAARAAAARDTFGARSAELLAVLDGYQRVTAELTERTFELADLAEEIREEEAEVRTRTEETRRLLIGAYAGAAVGELGPVLDLESFEQIAIVTDLLARSAAARDGSIEDYVTLRNDLQRRRATLDAEQLAVVDLRSRAETLVADLEALVDEARAADRSAASEAVAAESAHQRAVAELEAAKNSVSPRAYGWRDLIERYFPPDLLWEALQVLDCESRGDPDATNPTSGAAGLFQFLEGTWLVASTFAGFSGESPYEPEANVAAAAWLVRHSELIDHPRGTWGHWACQPLTGEPATTGSG